MRAIRLSKTEVDELTAVMSIGNTALKACADMMGMNYRDFRAKLFQRRYPGGPIQVTLDRLDTSKLTPEQLQQLNAAKPLIQAVHDKCEDRIMAGFRRMVMQQAYIAARNNYDPTNARDEFAQEGQIAVLDAIYGYTDPTKTKLSTFVWRCVRRRIVAAINRLNPFCPLTNEALEIVRRVQEVQDNNPHLSDEQAVEVVGLSYAERTVFFSAVTKVVNENIATPVFSEEAHNDDYTGNRKGVDRDIKEVFFLRKDARQALKDANLNEFELACLIADTFPYHGWKEDIASKHVNPRTGERYTRQNIQYVLERVKKRVRDAYVSPPETHLENPLVDKFFDEWDAERAVEEDQRSRR